MTTTTGAATKPRPTKATAKATDTTPSAHPMSPQPMAGGNGEAMRAELRKPLYAYIGAGDLALEKLREIPTEWPKISAAPSDEATKSATKLQEVMSCLLYT